MSRCLTVADLIKMNALQNEATSPAEPIGVFGVGALDAVVHQPAQEDYGRKFFPSIE